MSVLDWVLTAFLVALYLGCLFTVCNLTFQKGHIVLGIIGVFVPWLWLLGAILPAKRGSRYEIREAQRLQILANQSISTDQAGRAGPAAA